MAVEYSWLQKNVLNIIASGTSSDAENSEGNNASKESSSPSKKGTSQKSSTTTTPGGSNLIQGQPVIDALLKFLDTANIPQTKENIKFVKAWKQAETTKAKNSLFGSTQKYNNSTKFNGAGVQNYNSIEDSIKAHAKTIANKYYPNLYKDLKAGKNTALQIAQDNLKELKTWGTGGLLLTVLEGGVKDKNLKIYY